MKKKLIEYVQSQARHRFITFAELVDAVEGFSGDQTYGATEAYPGRVVWAGLSQGAIDAIEETDGRDVFLWPCEIAEYAPADRPDLPVLQGTPGEGSERSWLPMAFRNEPY